MNHLKQLAARLRDRAKRDHYRQVPGDMGMGHYAERGTELLEFAEDIEAVLDEPSEILRDGIAPDGEPTHGILRALGGQEVVGNPDPEVVHRALRAMRFLEDTTTLNDRAITRELEAGPGRMIVRIKDGTKQYVAVGKDFDTAFKEALEWFDHAQ